MFASLGARLAYVAHCMAICRVHYLVHQVHHLSERRKQRDIKNAVCSIELYLNCEYHWFRLIHVVNVNPCHLHCHRVFVSTKTPFCRSIKS